MMKTLRKHFTIIKTTTFVVCFAVGCLLVFSSFNGQNNLAESKITRCYPNPATSIINFEFQKSTSDITLQIYSFSGRKMTELPVNDTKLSVTLTNYYRGIYVYQLRDKDGKILQSGKFQVVK